MNKPSLSIDEITAFNFDLIDTVYTDIMNEVKTGAPRFDGPNNDAKFSEVPYYKAIVAKRNHDLLCFPK